MKPLADKRIVLAGGTGAVGEGIAKALISDGATIIVPFRTEAKKEQLQDYLTESPREQLVLYKANVGDPKGVKAFKTQVINEFGKIDMTIASLGGWVQGHDLVDTPIDLWQEILQNNLTSHFLFASAFVPVLKAQNEGLYVNINGGAQDFVAPKAGSMTIISSAQEAMTRVLHEEAKKASYRIRSVAAFTPVKTRARGEQVQPNWVSAEDIGHYITKLYLKQTKDDPITHKLRGNL
ncbi:MAG: SDR family NAD(P)-dependent oxidoreductase [Thermonemataceae bacterium]